MKTFLLLMTCLVFLAGCNQESQTVNVSDLNKQFIGAWNSKDSEKVISFLADDVQFLQGEVHFKGKAEVADKWVKATIATIKDLKTYVTSSGTDEQIAYEGGTFSVDVLPTAPNEPHATGEGNFILLWKKGADGAWKLHYAQLEDLPLRVKTP